MNCTYQKVCNQTVTFCQDKSNEYQIIRELDQILEDYVSRSICGLGIICVFLLCLLKKAINDRYRYLSVMN